jgi:hypothetical protein
MKIGVMKEKKIHIFIILIIIGLCVPLPFCFSLDMKDAIGIFIILFIAFIVVLICCLIALEWYILDEKSVTVKNIFGTINKVYYDDVKFVYIKKIKLFDKDIRGIPCILFDDGRSEGNWFRGNTVDNHKKHMVRIPYTQDVFDYFKDNNININIKSNLNILKN